MLSRSIQTTDSRRSSLSEKSRSEIVYRQDIVRVLSMNERRDGQDSTLLVEVAR